MGAAVFICLCFRDFLQQVCGVERVEWKLTETQHPDRERVVPLIMHEAIILRAN
jgi:hypothetical protein